MVNKKFNCLGSFLLIVYAFLFICPNISLAQKDHPYETVKLISHRGMNMGYPENSLAAIEAAFKNGIHGVEVDLRTTADNHIIIMHDERLERTTNGSGNVHEKSWDEIRQLRLKDNEGNPSSHSVPDLKSVIAFVKKYPHLLLALDLKDVDAVKVAKMILKHGLENQVIFFVADPMNTELAKSITNLDPELRIIVDVLNWWKIEEVPLFTAKALDTDMLFASEWFFPQRGFHHLNNQGIEVVAYIWGQHDILERFRKAADLGATYISTDAPLTLLPLVAP